jgi:hypothetical protein
MVRDKCPAARGCGLQLDQRSALQRRERVEARRRRRQGVLVLNASEVDWFETLDFVHLAPQECEPGSRRSQDAVIAFGLHLLGASVIPPRRLARGAVSGASC